MAPAIVTLKLAQLLYNVVFIGITALGAPFFILTLIRPKRRVTVRHRLGGLDCCVKQSGGMPSMQPIWIHALSVGEVLSAEPLVLRVLEHLATHPVVISVSTQTGMETARRLFDDKVQKIFYYPYDFTFSVRQVVDRVDPLLVVVVETDIWPNFLFHLKRRGVPVLWVNARISSATFKGYRILGRFARIVLDTFFRIGAQSNQDADRLAVLQLPEDKVMLTGNVKFDQEGCVAPEEVDRRIRMDLKIDPDRQILVAGSTHAGEEALFLSCFAELKLQFKKLSILLAPRDPLRAESITKLCSAKGLTFGYISDLNTSVASCDVWIVNAIGLLRQLYAIADIAVVGGSFVAQGGHNPLEPAAYAKPILFGPDMSDFSAVAQLLLRNYAAMQIQSEDLEGTIAGLLNDASHRQRMGAQALKVFNVNKGAVDKTLTMIEHALLHTDNQ